MKAQSYTFRFKQFAITDLNCGLKLGTDGVLAGVLATLPSIPHPKAIDVGAGCGIISLILAQRFPSLKIHSVEIDGRACEDLQCNVTNSPWSDRIEVVKSDFRNIAGQFDLIISNPPYFQTGEISPCPERAAARHAESLSAISLIDYAQNHLTEDGLLEMILPSSDIDDVIAYAAFQKLYMAQRIDVVTSRRKGITRSFLEFTKKIAVIPEISILDMASEDFRQLTSDLYLN